MNFRKYEFLYVIIKKHMEIQKIKKNAPVQRPHYIQ